MCEMCRYISHKIATVGCFNAKVKYKDNYASAKFYVIEKYSSLLGKDFIQILGVNEQGKHCRVLQQIHVLLLLQGKCQINLIRQVKHYTSCE